MDRNQILKQVEELEKTADLLQRGVMMLKKELVDGGASSGSPRKGLISEDEKRDILLSRKRKRIEKIAKSGKK